MFAPSKETNPEQMNYYDMEPTAFKGMSKVIGGRPLTEAEQASDKMTVHMP